MDNKEVEAKFKIDKSIKDKILSVVEKSCKLVGEARVVDTYYIPYFRDFEIDGQTMECMRIREKGGKSILAYKKIHRETEPVYCDEFEVEVLSKEQTEKILFALGFSVQMVIDKVRLSYENNEFRFDFDSVQGLGELFEIELKNPEDDFNKILIFVSQFGLRKEDVTYEGIQVMMKNVIGK